MSDEDPGTPDIGTESLRNSLSQVRIKDDDNLRRFYDHRGADGIAHEEQLLVDFLCASTGGPMVYTGRDMKSVHVGMRLDEEDWKRAMAHLTATLDAFEVPEQEKGEVMSFHGT